MLVALVAARRGRIRVPALTAGVILFAAAIAAAQAGSIPDLRGSFHGWACLGGTVAQCEAHRTFPQTFTITTEDFSSGAVAGSGTAPNGDSWTVSGTISGRSVTLNESNFKKENYSSTAVLTISADANTLTGTFSDSLGRQNQPTFAERILPRPAAPVLGRSVDVAAVRGQVFVKLPGAAPVAPGPQGQGFIPLTQARQIPVGSILDTTAGTVRLTTATATRTRVQFGDFSGGIFAILQQRNQRGLTDLTLVDARSAQQACVLGGKARAARRRLSSKVLGLLNSTAHGRFTTRTSYSATTVRGTAWRVTDRCDGTLTRVSRGVVVVRDFRRRKSIVVHAGASYLARAPGA